MLDGNGGRLEHSSCKSLAWLAQLAQVLITKVWKAIRTLHLWPYKITKVQVIEDSDFKRRM
jgi:hypothetical protein